MNVIVYGEVLSVFPHVAERPAVFNVLGEAGEKSLAITRAC